MLSWRRENSASLALLLAASAVAFPAAAQSLGGDVDPRLCQALSAHHRPAPDVEYIPGVDARGRAVAPADLPGSAGASRQTLDRFEIPITLGKLPGNAEVGRLVIDGNRVTFNGQQVGGSSQAALAAACGRYR